MATNQLLYKGGPKKKRGQYNGVERECKRPSENREVEWRIMACI